MDDMITAPLSLPPRVRKEGKVSFCEDEVPPSPLSPRKSVQRHVSENGPPATHIGSPVDMYIYSALEKKP